MVAKQVIDKIKSGNNSSALKSLYKAYPSVRSFIKSHGGTEEDAKDVFQESLVVFYRQVMDKPNFELSCTIKTYLYRICQYMWKDRLKAKKKFVTINVKANIIHLDGLDDLLEKEKRFQQLDQILLTIGQKCMDILTKYYLQKMSMKDIATVMNYTSVNSAKTSKYKCLERAKKLITTSCERN